MDDKTQAAPTIRERVAAGAAWLDRARPGWPVRIDLITLDVRDPEHCVLGQEFDDFSQRPEAMRAYEVAEAHGFYLNQWPSAGREMQYAVLTDVWRELIEGRILPAAKACCPCQRAVCEPGCTCTSPDCPKSEAEVLDD